MSSEDLQRQIDQEDATKLRDEILSMTPRQHLLAAASILGSPAVIALDTLTQMVVSRQGESVSERHARAQTHLLFSIAKRIDEISHKAL